MAYLGVLDTLKLLVLFVVLVERLLLHVAVVLLGGLLLCVLREQLGIFDLWSIVLDFLSLTRLVRSFVVIFFFLHNGGHLIVFKLTVTRVVFGVAHG